MPNTYTQLLYHVVFATKYREQLIRPKYEKRLHAYVGGIIRNEQGILIAAGGMADHIHLAFRLGTTRALADVVRVVKSKSAIWFNELDDYPGRFSWQRGYSAFTVSKSKLPLLIDYVTHQKEHHQGKTYLQELRQLLRAHEIDFEEQYLID